jgi:colanic acid biosynthesis glycosyl transferase WcaI
VYERACYWERWGHSVTVITCFPNFPEGKLYPGFKNKIRQVSLLDAIRVVRILTFIAPNAGKLLRILDFLSYMLSAIAMGTLEAKPDLVVATSPQFFTAVAAWVLSVVHGVPFVMEVSDLWPGSIVAVGAMKRSFSLRCLERIELFLYAKAKRIVVLTRSFERDLVARGVNSEKIDVVINGVDLPRYGPREPDYGFAAPLGISPDDFVVGYLGTLGMAHGLQNVLRAAALVKNPRIRFLLIGPGAEREQLAAKAAEWGLRNVIIAPPQTKENMPAAWSICNVALVHLKDNPLFKTVIPSKIFEAMGMGLPILLATPKGEASTIIETEDCGVSIAPGDPGALTSAAERLASNPSELKRMAGRSRSAAPKYSRERQAREMILSLERAIGSYEDAVSALKARESVTN